MRGRGRSLWRVIDINTTKVPRATPGVEDLVPPEGDELLGHEEPDAEKLARRKAPIKRSARDEVLGDGGRRFETETTEPGFWDVDQWRDRKPGGAPLTLPAPVTAGLYQHAPPQPQQRCRCYRSELYPFVLGDHHPP